MVVRLPSFDAAPLSGPSPKAPLPPESPVHEFEDGVMLCEIPTPYMMGSTNCWLVIGDDEVLCVDPGAEAAEAARRIEATLEPYGRAVTDIETILVTHTHPDHCGGVAGLAEVADATVAVGVSEIDRLAGKPDPRDAVTAAWLSLGAPPSEVERAARSRPVHPPVPADRLQALHDGTRLRAGGREWDVHLVAGHSPGHVVLVGDGMMLAGDHLLANVFPAAHCGPVGSAEHGPRERDGLLWAPSVDRYLASMDRFDEGFESMTVLPGHGSAFLGTARPVERVRRYHRIRCELVAARLAQRGPTSVWDLTLEMYAGLVSEAGIDRRFASAAAEIAGRLEALVRVGRAKLTRGQDHEGVVFSPA